MLVDFLQALGMLFLILCPFGGAIMTGVWILRPIDKSAKRFRRPTRFTILDFFGLVFLVQLPMALTLGLVPRREPAIFWAFLIVGWAVSTAVWATAVKTFSNAGIEDVWDRAILVFYVLPMAYFGTFAVVIIAMVLVAMPAGTVLTWLGRLGGEVLLVCGVIYAGRLAKRVAPDGWQYNASEGSPFALPGAKKSEPDPAVVVQQIESYRSQQQSAAEGVDSLFRGPSID